VKTTAEYFFRIAAWSFGVAFVPVFFVVRYFESARVFDSIGTWYTLIVAAVSSAIMGAVIASAAVLLRRGAN
jgi:hypothetical protein